MNEQRAVEAVEVTQADREALADLFDLPASSRARLLSDDPKDSAMTLVKLERIARHRIASVAAARPVLFEEAAEIALQAATCNGFGERPFERIIGEDIAQAIRTAGSKTDASQ